MLGTEEEDILEVLQALELGYLVEGCLPGISIITHRQLLETCASLELLQDPDTSSNDRRTIDFVAQVR